MFENTEKVLTIMLLAIEVEKMNKLKKGKKDLFG